MNALIPDHSPLFQHPLVLFDGKCNLCDRTVNFIIKRDRAEIFRFVPLQSPLGIALLVQFGFPADYRESFVLIDQGQAVTKSTAFVRIGRKLPQPWPLCALAAVIPRPLRDFVYTHIGRNRYHWFGQHDYCEVRTDDLGHRFITETPIIESERSDS